MMPPYCIAKHICSRFLLLHIIGDVYWVCCRPEMVVGWYHSHPGFGCWLSGVDINTQQVPHLQVCVLTGTAALNLC